MNQMLTKEQQRELDLKAIKQLDKDTMKYLANDPMKKEKKRFRLAPLIWFLIGMYLGYTIGIN
jgi:hypothetical protein